MCTQPSAVLQGVHTSDVVLGYKLATKKAMELIHGEWPFRQQPSLLTALLLTRLSCA